MIPFSPMAEKMLSHFYKIFSFYVPFSWILAIDLVVEVALQQLVTSEKNQTIHLHLKF